MNPRLYCEMALSEGSVIDLPAAAAHHASRVLRLREGDPITLFNGEGGEFEALLSRIAPKAVSAAVGAHRAIERESPLDITLMQGLASAERMDWAIQKAVELGVAAIAPVTMARSVTRLDAPRAAKRAEHWRAVIVAACEQCGRNRLPLLHPLVGFADALARPRLDDAAVTHEEILSLAFSPDDGIALAAIAAPAGAVRVLVGPEGGLTADELSAAKRAGFQTARFGPRVLRTETAGVAVLAAMNALWGDAR
jgi:16S rRNA (uracil1498-N3)-methyltransferase